ncbi:3,4-dioxygenase subunit beta [Enemella dayhoffiae]|uniref:3,4-dioxygenase subunit beta n=1 Tax=Enemella dayhoffiae TaxID=2016507 RepID=A0A255GN48_9ACTN|nr:3,4-dioxygenase subunit beta [Enemella dayhoffiae]OYO17247.1 3,4-dioxygenase subunit beta [Enemella dayhoffiae]
MTDPNTENDRYVRAVHDRGLGFDLGTLNRRRALLLFGGGAAGLLGLAGCAPQQVASGSTAAADTTSTSTTGSTAGSGSAGTASTQCVTEVPDETAGPYPGDGSNGANALTQSGIVRTDLRSSFGGPSGVAAGVPLTMELTVLNLAQACRPLVGGAVYLWHADQLGQYSMYSSAIRNENYLRGVAETDGNGTVRFTTIYPGCYDGRWPHLHFEVFGSLAAATSGRRQIVKTSQIALPEDASRAVYASTGYTRSTSNLDRTSLGRDMVFRDDNGARQLATVTGSARDGYVAKLTVAVN